MPAWERRLVGAIGRNVFFRDRRGGPWPLPPDLRAEAVEIAGNTGARLPGRLFLLDDRPVHGMVVLVHPDRRYAQHWFVREGIVPWLLAHGLECLTFDLAAYGSARGGSTYMTEDVVAAARLAADESGGLPVHLWGQSLGAFLAANAAKDVPDLGALVLESPYPDYVSWAGDRPRAWLSRAWYRTFPRSAETIDLAANLPRARARRVLVAASAADVVTPPALSRRAAEHGPPGRTRYLEVANAPHLALFGEPSYREALLDAFGVPVTSAKAARRRPAAAAAPRQP